MLIGKHSFLDIFAEYTGPVDGAEAQLVVTFSGNQVIRVTLVGRLGLQALSSPRSAQSPPINIFFDTGTVGENTSMVDGNTRRYGVDGSVAISGTDTPQYFRTHRSGPSFTYTISGLSPEMTLSVSLGFAEIWTPNCKIGGRIMVVSLNNNVVNPDLDIYKEVGCNTAYVETYSIKATSKGTIEISLDATVETAMLSFIKVESS